MIHHHRLLLALLLLALVPPSRAQFTPATNGLYARFTTTLGEFTCRLRPDLAPRTVANFVGLAEGSRPFIDFSKGQLTSRPFYTNILFHRVISNFVIQAGSPNGRGTDGPGYTFGDEFSPQLRHNGPGLLSMANTGAPKSNGSQFFVTLAATPWLNDVHSIFGSVVDGMAVVEAIGKTPTTNSVPTTPVSIQKLEILRIGAEFAAYDPSIVSPPLPVTRSMPFALTSMTKSNVTLAWTRGTNCAYRVGRAPVLGTNWLVSNEFVSQTATVFGAGTTNSSYYFFLLENDYHPVDW